MTTESVDLLQCAARYVIEPYDLDGTKQFAILDRDLGERVYWTHDATRIRMVLHQYRDGKR